MTDTNDISDSNITIQTHDKRFHADDVGAVSLLISYFNQKNKQVLLIRSRNPTLLEKADILVDVGGIYDSDTNRYDHHQDDCNEVFDSGFIIPLSSIGMVWKHFGKKILKMYIEANNQFSKISNWEDHLDKLHTEVYIKCVQELDAHDNGIAEIEGGKRNYWTHLSLGSVISSINTTNTNDEEAQMRAFHKAVEIFGNIFEIKLEETIRKYFDYTTSLEIVKTCLDEASNDREYLIITDKVPTIYKCLNNLDPRYRIKFLIFSMPDESEITVRTRSHKDVIFKPMVPLLNYEQSLDVIGDEKKKDLIFVHKNLFIAKTKTLELAKELVGHALKNHYKNTGSIPLSYFQLPSFKPSRLGWIVGGGLGVLGVGLGGYYLTNNHQ